jgi:Zn-dependent M16 (insulinase) family peptidase
MPSTLTYSQLSADAVLHGFQAKAVYLNAASEAMGGRFVHQASGFTLDLLEIQSVPQAFLNVMTFPVSNMGEPHTQEHLLLGKGNVGRALSARETMSLVESTAFTSQLRTSYPFSTTAGPEVFFAHCERFLHAMLSPDYTDEEIRREVRNFGVKQGPEGRLELEEKGTIYAEMQSAVSKPGYRAYRTIGRMVYGTQHPMALDSGGDPKYIREMKAEDIRNFHAANYYLANMEMVMSLPRPLELGEFLERMDGMLCRLQGERARRKPVLLSDLPLPQPAPDGSIAIAEFPSLDEQQPGPAFFAWPPKAPLHPNEFALAQTFFEGVAGDPSTNLYKVFIDSKTRRMDIGARSISMSGDNEGFFQVTAYVPDLGTAMVSEEKLAEIRGLILEELERIAAWEDGSAELAEFSGRLEAAMLRTRRQLDKLTSSPPGFGARMGSSVWPSLLRELAEYEGFQKKLTLDEQCDFVEAAIHSGTNVWREKLREWGLLGVKPMVAAVKASPEMLHREEAEYQERLAQEEARLKLLYGTEDGQEAIRLYGEAVEAASAELERVAAADEAVRFIENPPLGLDEPLDAVVEEIGGVPCVVGRFAGMQSATVGLALRVDSWTGREWVYAAILPQLLSGCGMRIDGELLSNEEAMQRMRREILGMSAGYAANFVTGRKELTLTASGNTLAETKRALEWMAAALYEPNWGMENVTRLRDVVDQTLNSLRTMMQRSEENWVSGPANAWQYQNDGLYLSMTSFLTRTLHLLRLRWLLAAPPSEDCVENADLSKDLETVAADLPEASKAADLEALTAVLWAAYRRPVEETLTELDAARRKVLVKAQARLHVTGSAQSAEALVGPIEKVLAGLGAGAPAEPARPLEQPLLARLRQREAVEGRPAFVALRAPSMQGGVFLLSAPFRGIRELDEEALLDALASRLFGGGGPHGVFMKTWEAGLAYSNGLRLSLSEGRISYYAERTPELPQTLRFVIQSLKSAPREQDLAEYALAQSFSASRAAGSFEGRTAALAEDLADGMTPDVVANYRRALLELRRRPDLGKLLYERMDAAYERVLPGYGASVKDLDGGVYFVIGPDKQLDSWESYLREVEGPDVKLQRLAPRDFWVVVE